MWSRQQPVVAGPARSFRSSARASLRLLFLFLLPLVAQAVLLDPDEVEIFRQFYGNLTAKGSKWNPGDFQGLCDNLDYTCDTNGRLTRIYLNSFDFNTTIPSVISKFTELQEIDLRYSLMQGTIPPEIFQPKLLSLDLSGNALSGTIPPQILNSPNLQRFAVGTNSLNGTIPEFLALMPNLTDINFTSNKFSCPLPVAVLNRTDFTACTVGSNPLITTFDGLICNNTPAYAPNGTLCRLYPTLALNDLRSKTPQMQFETTLTKFKVHGSIIKMHPKQPDGSILPLVYSSVQVPSLLISESPTREEWPLRKFDNITELSPGVYRFFSAIDSVYAKGVSLILNVTDPVQLVLSIRVHDVWVDRNDNNNNKIPRTFIGVPLILHTHFPLMDPPSTGARPRCTYGLVLGSRNTQCTSSAGDDIAIRELSSSPRAVAWTYTGSNMTFYGVAPHYFTDPTLGTVILPEYRGAQTSLSGSVLAQNTAVVPNLDLPAVEHQGVDLYIELGQRMFADGEILWDGINLTVAYPMAPVESPQAPVPPTGSSNAGDSGVLGAIVILPIVIIAILVAVFLVRRRRKQEARDDDFAAAAASAPLGTMIDSGIDPSLVINFKDLSLMQQLGAGSFGTVHLAMYKGEFVAVKTLAGSEGAAAQQQQINALLREAAVMSTIRQNKNVVKLLGVCADSNSYSLVMEFCPRGSLSSFLKRNKTLSEYAEFKLLFSIAEGMVALSSSNLVHCDLAARNILLDERIFGKVSDFGYSHRATDTNALVGQDVNSIGPVKWQAPEVLNSDFGGDTDFEFTSASDVWSYGCTVIEIFTHREPYHGYQGSLLQLANEIRRNGLNPLDHLNKVEGSLSKDRRLPEWILPLLQSCFQPKPADRPTFREIRYQLSKLNRTLFNQYENEIDDAESLLLGSLDQQPQQQYQTLLTAPGQGRAASASTSSGWAGATAPTSGGLRNTFDPEDQIEQPTYKHQDIDFGSKVDLSQVQTLSKLGEGNFGAVFLGISQGTYVAVKVLTVSANPEEVKREAAVMANIQQHRNIVQLYGLIGTAEQDRLSIVMEFAPRGSLESFLKKAASGADRVTEGLQFKWAVGIARGMKALASSKIVHRDLATRNVLLDSNLEAKISDFGMSRVVLDASQESSTRTAVGPIKWYAPECFDLKYSEKSDVWAYGCTLIEMITGGETPLAGMTILEIADAIRDQQRSPLEFVPSAALKATPDWLVETMKLCFINNPTQRASFGELVSFLEERGRTIDAVKDAEEEIQKRRQRRAGSLRLGDASALKNVK